MGMMLRTLVLAALLGLSACLVSSTEKTETEGRPVSGETLARVHPGMAAGEVVGLLGEPSVTTQVDDETEIWRWTYRTEKRSTGNVFLLFSSTKVEQMEGAVNVELRNGRVAKTWRDKM